MQLIRNDCYGCQYNRDSQLDHDVCAMMSSEERMNIYFDKACQQMNTPESYMNAVRNYIQAKLAVQ